MKIKPIHILSTLVVIIAICAITWIALHKQDIAPIVTFKATVPEKHTAATTESTKETAQVRQEAAAERAKRKREQLMDFNREMGNENHPYIQALNKAMNSPAYIEFEKEPFSVTRWFDFLESQGINSYRNMYEDSFRHRYPEGTLASYEPMMKKRLAKLFLAADSMLLDETDKLAVVDYTLQVLEQFFDENPEENATWHNAYFLETDHYKRFEWANNVRKNAASIVANAPPTQQVQMVSEPIDIPGPSPSEAVEETSTAAPQTPQFTENTLSPEASKQIPQTIEEIQAEFLEQLNTKTPDLPTDADFETALREHFSPQRFNTAMETLNQYGPKEGLRRLKESDPEVAAQIERLIQRNKETD